MAENGILDYQGMNQAIYRGATSNIVVDTQSMSIEIGAGNSSHTSNLHIECDHAANVASIQLNSNVVTEFSRSKKLIKYPRVAMTSGQSGLSGGYTQDGYTVEASSELTESGVLFAASNVFNSIQAYQSTDYAWSSAANRYGTGGLATNGTSKDTFQGIDGSWIGLTLPIAIRLDHIHMYNRAENSVHVCPAKSGIIWASNDGISWYRILSFDNLQKTDGALNVLRVNSTNFYTRYRVQITANNPDPVKTAVMIGELELFGTPEYDPEAHGTDVTVKSVTNVPNTDWLEVYYDAKGETTMPNPVTDLAGGDQDASVYGVTLDTTNEAFVFNGSSYLETDIPQITTGVWPFTMSFWFKVNAHIGSTWNYLAHLGIRGTHGESTLVGLKDDLIAITTWGDSKIVSSVVPVPGVWYHVTSTWPGGPFYDNAKLYINAVSYGDSSGTRDETSPLSFPTSGNKLTLGKQMDTTSDYFDGSIANFRLFNRALTSDEIYQLYAYQKEDFGHGDLSMTLKAGRLGIGTSEPRAALDVRGDFYAHGSVVQIQTSVFTDTATTSNSTWKDISSTFGVTITPKFTNSSFLLQAMIHQGGDQSSDGRWTMYRIGRYVHGDLTEVGNGDPSNTGGIGTGCVAAHNWGGFGSTSSGYDQHQANINILYVDIPNTTSPITYRIRWNSNPGGNNGTRKALINRAENHGDGYRANTISTLVVTEIAQ